MQSTTTTAAQIINALSHQSVSVLSQSLSSRQDVNTSTTMWEEKRSPLHMPDLALSGGEADVVLAGQQKYIIQVVVTCMASLSISSSLLALYWFCLMRRNYRRDLVLLLILSDCFKNFCYIMFAGVQLNSKTGVQTTDDFCQASGFLLQIGLEACDFAILFISLHMTLQIFPLPNTIFGYDGLYNVRYWVFALWIILPIITASLAFINNIAAYAVQGAWCWLPVRPFWYRLALAWIPRYIISIVILGFAIVIYAYVGKEFKIFRRERDRASSVDFMTSTPSSSELQSTTRSASGTFIEPRDAMTVPTEAIPPTQLDAPVFPIHRPSVVDRLEQEARRNSMPAFESPFASAPMDDLFDPRRSRSATTSRRGSKQVAFEGLPSLTEPPPISPKQEPQRIGSIAAVTSEAETSPTESPRADLEMLPVIEEARTTNSVSASTAVDETLRLRRKAIKRQVRGLFIYPVAYILFWILPFAYHCMNYSAHYATHPIFAMSFLSSFCTASLGLVDASIFCFREQPWRHIQGSDGTFLGSFMFWRFLPQRRWTRRPSLMQTLLTEKNGSQDHDGIIGFFKNAWRRLSTSSASESPGLHPRMPRFKSVGGGGGGADREVREKEVAQERLRREREDFEMKQAEMRQTRAEQDRGSEPPSAISPSTAGARNWFDRELDIEGEDEVHDTRQT